MWSTIQNFAWSESRPGFRLRRRVRIACELIPWSAQGDPKIKEKTWHISEPTFLARKCKHIWKKAPTLVPKCESILGGGGLGGALRGIFWFLMSKIVQKCSKGVQKCSKSAAKVPPGTENYSTNNPKGAKNVSKRAPQKSQHSVLFFNHFWWEHVRHNTHFAWSESRPGGLREAL